MSVHNVVGTGSYTTSTTTTTNMYHKNRFHVLLHRQGIGIEELSNVHPDQATVEIVGDAASVVGVGDQILKSVPGCFFIGVDVNAQDIFADEKITFVEFVRDVKTQISKFTAFDQQGMKPTQTKQQGFVFLFLFATFVTFVGHQINHAHEIRTQP